MDQRATSLRYESTSDESIREDKSGRQLSDVTPLEDALEGSRLVLVRIGF
jgi:hypothetical protein